MEGDSSFSICFPCLYNLSRTHGVSIQGIVSSISSSLSLDFNSQELLGKFRILLGVLMCRRGGWLGLRDTNELARRGALILQPYRGHFFPP